MPTIPCSKEQLNKAFSKFYKEIGDKSNSQEGIKGLHKGLMLHYLGVEATDSEIDNFAMHLQVATTNAMYRGWEL